MAAFTVFENVPIAIVHRRHFRFGITALQYVYIYIYWFVWVAKRGDILRQLVYSPFST